MNPRLVIACIVVMGVGFHNYLRYERVPYYTPLVCTPHIELAKPWAPNPYLAYSEAGLWEKAAIQKIQAGEAYLDFDPWAKFERVGFVYVNEMGGVTFSNMVINDTRPNTSWCSESLIGYEWRERKHGV